MTDPATRLREDRAMRDAALALVIADVAQVRAELAGKSIPERILSRVTDGAVEVFEEAVEVADNNRGVLATLLAAIVIWFARNPIISLFKGDEDEVGEETNVS